MPAAASSTLRPSGLCDVRVDRPPRRLDVEPDPPAEEVLRVDEPEHEVGVGHGRQLAAAAVAGGPGHGAGALGPDAQVAARPRRYAIEPPPAPIARTSTIGSRKWYLPSDHVVALARGSPSTIRPTSVEVPPMSNVIDVRMPERARRGTATR